MVFKASFRTAGVVTQRNTFWEVRVAQKERKVYGVFIYGLDGARCRQSTSPETS